MLRDFCIFFLLEISVWCDLQLGCLYCCFAMIHIMSLLFSFNIHHLDNHHSHMLAQVACKTFHDVQDKLITCFCIFNLLEHLIRKNLAFIMCLLAAILVHINISLNHLPLQHLNFIRLHGMFNVRVGNFKVFFFLDKYVNLLPW